MSKGKHMDNDPLNRYLLDIIEKQEIRFDCRNSKPDVNLRLYDLLTAVYQKTGKQVVVLIDEYDAPLLDVVHEKETLDALLAQMSGDIEELAQALGFSKEKTIDSLKNNYDGYHFCWPLPVVPVGLNFAVKDGVNTLEWAGKFAGEEV